MESGSARMRDFGTAGAPRAEKVALVADAHLEGPGGEPQALFEQLARLPQLGYDRLVLLGDTLQVWVGLERFETSTTLELQRLLRGLRSEGVAVDVIEGNRDFFLDAAPVRECFDRLGTELALEVAGKRCLLVHGDQVDTGDLGYRAWRFVSKSRPMRWGASLLPRSWTLPLVHGLERRLAHTNFEHRHRVPEEAIRRFAQERLALGYDFLVLGHFHEERRLRTGAGHIWLLEAWFRSRRVETLSSETLRALEGVADPMVSKTAIAEP